MHSSHVRDFVPSHSCLLYSARLYLQRPYTHYLLASLDQVLTVSTMPSRTAKPSGPATKNPNGPPTIDIRAYGRICKTSTITNAACKDQMLRKDGQITRKMSAMISPIPSPKRKRALSEDALPSDEEGSPRETTIAAKRRKTNGVISSITAANCTPSKSHAKYANPQSLPTPETTPTKPQSPRSYDIVAQHNGSAELDEEDDAEDADESLLPPELLHILDMHSSFLRALSLAFAHHGTSTPIDIRLLMPSMTKIWGRRTVTIVDVRRIMAVILAAETVQDGDEYIPSRHSFAIFEYGAGKVSIERCEGSVRSGVLTGHIDEEASVEIFKHELRRRWNGWTAQENSNENENTAIEFLEQLPLCPIPLHPSVRQAAPLLDKGKIRLDTLKALAATSARLSTSLSSTKTKAKTPAGRHSRQSTLLERIKAKEALQAATHTRPPTKQETARKAALHRLPDTAAVMIALSGKSSGGAGPSRQTYSLQGLIQQIQDSTRSPLSKEEIGDCLDLIAAEAAPGWVRMVRAGGSVMGVVVDGSLRPDDVALESWRRDQLALG